MKLKTILSYAGISLAGLHLINKYTSYKASSSFSLNKYNDFTYNWSYGNIFYIKQGIGEPILFIHDLTPGSSSYEWHSILSQSNENFTCYSLDLIGCGLSDKPNFTYTNYLFVKLITDFIHDVIKVPCTIVASGSSSSIALMSSLEEQSYIKNIILINPLSLEQCNHTINQDNRNYNKIINIPVIGTFLANRHNKREDIEDLFYNTYFNEKEKVNPKDIDAYYASYHTGKYGSKSLFSSIYNNYTQADISIALKNTNFPISIIGGENESDINETIAGYQQLNPSINSFIISDSKHLPQLEHPDELLHMIISIIE